MSVPWVSHFHLCAILLVAGLFVMGSAGPVVAEETAPPPDNDSVAEETAPPPDDDPAETWAVVDPDTGNVLNIIVCTESMCGQNGQTGGKLQDGETGIVGNLVRQGTLEGGGWRTDTQYGGGTSVKWQEDKQSFLVEQKNGPDDASSFRVTPQSGTGFKTSDFETKSTLRKDDQSVDVRVFRSEIDSARAEIDLGFSLWTPSQRVFSYVFESGSGAGSSGLQSLLEQISSDVDSALIEDGHLENHPLEADGSADAQDLGIDGEGNVFVDAIRALTKSATEFLAGFFGFSGATN